MLFLHRIKTVLAMLNWVLILLVQRLFLLHLPVSLSSSLCGYSTSKQHKLRKHFDKKHPDLETGTLSDSFQIPQKDEKVTKCPYCGVIFPTFRELSKHCKSEHTKDSLYPCTYCERQFKGFTHLIRHLRTHTGEKPYACHFCPYKCTQKVHLVQHIRTHTSERPYQCKTCLKGFTQSSSRNTHIRKGSCVKLLWVWLDKFKLIM